MSTPQPSFKGLPIQINVFAEFVKRWALDNNTSYSKALKSKKMKKDFYAYRETLPLSKPTQQIAQFAPSSFMKADISPNQPNIPSDVADIAPEMGDVYPEQSVVEETPPKIRIIPKKPKKPVETTYEKPEGVIIENIEGGKLSAAEIKSFVSASYIDHPDPTIDDYLLDTKLSNETAKVYYNPKQKRAVVVHRGTQGLSDWGNNLAYALGGYEMTDRYKMGKDTQNKAEKKYGAKNISTLGHSQGAILARKLGANTKEIITVNPAYKFEKPLPNEFVIRSSSDVVSGAYAPVASARSVLMPKKSQNRDITIPSENRFDVLGEHSSDILDRLPADQMIGAGTAEPEPEVEAGSVKNARPYKIQTILFSKDKWTKKKASSWLKKHNYSNKGVDDKPDTLRYRQLDPSYVEQIGYNQYVTKPLGASGVSLVIVYK